MLTWPLLSPCLCLCLWAPACPQDPVSRPTTQGQDLKRLELLFQKWLDKDQRSEELRTQVVKAVAAGGARTIGYLAAQAAKAQEGTDPDRARALDSVICHVGLHWLEHVKKSNMVYAGQYSVLAPLQPTVGEFYLGLVLDTPQWFPDNRRVEVVPAIRDLYPKSPGDAVHDRIKQIASNEDAEPLALRTTLKYALAQWGDRSLIKDHIQKLGKDAESKDAETSMLALKELADVHYQMRDYLTAARMHNEFLKKAEAEDYYRVPADYYNAACCMSLSGNVVSALDLLDRCLKLNSSDRVDPSVKLQRALFEKDPEIRAVRKTKRFRQLVFAAFGSRSSKTNDKQTRRGHHKDR